jgi:hypothetical protein
MHGIVLKGLIKTIKLSKFKETSTLFESSQVNKNIFIFKNKNEIVSF